MRRLLLRRVLPALLLLPVLLLALLFAALNTGPGQRLAADAVGGLTGGEVVLSGLSGRFPDALRVARLQLRDADGVWFEGDELVLDWSPLRLLHGTARVDRLTAARLALPRLPRPAASQPASSGAASLPVSVEVSALHVARFELGAPVAGHAAVLALDGHARLPSLTRGDGALDIKRLDAPGRYQLDGRADSDGLALHVVASEPAQGLATALAGLPDLVPPGDALKLDARLDGPWSNAALQAALSAGPMAITAKGTLDLAGRAAQLDLAAHAPAMAPRPDLRWGSVDITAHVQGTLAAPVAKATLKVTKLQGFGAKLGAFSAELGAKNGKLVLDSVVSGLDADGLGGVFAAAPVTLHAESGMDAKAVDFTLDHPALRAHGTLRKDGESDIALAVPELARFAALGGVDLRGAATLDAKVTLAPELAAEISGTASLTGGSVPLVGLIGRDGRFSLRASRKGENFVVSGLALDGAALHATAKGGVTGGVLGLDWTLGLPDMTVLTPTLAGGLALQGQISGKPDDISVTAGLTGELAVAGQPSGPVTATLTAHGLPNAPSGRIEAGGTLDGAKLDLLATASRDAAGLLRLDIARADWKSLHGEGALSLAPGATLPQGRVALGMQDLSDLDRLMGGRLAGSLSAEAVLGPDDIKVTLDGAGLGAAGNGAAKVGLVANVRDPLGARVTQATLTVSGLRGAGLGGQLRLVADGPPEALGLTLAADLSGVTGAPLAARAAAVLDAQAQHLDLASFTADWRGQHLALARRLRVDFADGGATLDELALRLGAASLSVKGRVAPSLDVTAALRDVPTSLASLFAPEVKLAGTLSGDARLTGPAARPAGTIRLRLAGLRALAGPASTLKPADLVASATLAGDAATLDATLTAGADRLSLRGTAPLGAGKLDLRAQGQVDLAALNAVVAAEGRQVGGKLGLDARIAGTAAAPLVSGTLRLAGGVVQDIPLGLRLHDIAAELSGNGQSIRLVSLTAKAGPGSIAANGTLSLTAPMPLALNVTAKDAQLLASELIRGTLDADLAVKGTLLGEGTSGGALAASGSITIGRTDIRVPDTLPAGVATLDVRRPGDTPPPPAAPGPTIGLDIRVRAPGQIFVRGRGLDAELQGFLRLGGTSADPRPSGRFTLRRGSFTLAGKTLAFDSGAVGFDGGLPVDPTLDFSASTTSGDVTATLTVTGHASAPKIALSSSPELPQDEILAQLLFQKSAVNLGPVELAQIAAALAQIAGGSGFDPLERVRAGLGLDRLSVSGGGAGTTGATVEAGRTLARGVYVGARQNTAGTGTKGTVEIDLGRGLKLQAGIGSTGTNSATGASGGTGTDIGVTYQFDY